MTENFQQMRSTMASHFHRQCDQRRNSWFHLSLFSCSTLQFLCLDLRPKKTKTNENVVLFYPLLQSHFRNVVYKGSQIKTVA